MEELEELLLKYKEFYPKYPCSDSDRFDRITKVVSRLEEKCMKLFKDDKEEVEIRKLIDLLIIECLRFKEALDRDKEEKQGGIL